MAELALLAFAAAALAVVVLVEMCRRWGRLQDGLIDLHVPMVEPVEYWHGDDVFEGDVPGPCPDPDDRGRCTGHERTIQVCQECGYAHNGDFPTYRVWPCPTVRLLEEARGV